MTFQTSGVIRAVVLREQAQGQKVQLVLVDEVVQVECSPGYRILATRTRNGSTAVLDPEWKYDAQLGVEHSEFRIATMGMSRFYKDFRAERKEAAR